MKAIVYRKLGSPDLLTYEEIEKPVPTADQVLIKVRAASANPLDWRMLSGGPYPIRKVLGLFLTQATPGRDVAGTVEAVGANVTRFKPGDEVFGACPGSFAEYACARERGLVHKPANVTFEQAASAPVAALTALQGLRDHGCIQPGHKLLINGAAGGVGTFTVQIAKALGAGIHVTGVCSTRNVEMVRSIGADHVIDYTHEDFTQTGIAGDVRYDLIYDTVGNHPFSVCRRLLRPDGRYVGVGGPKDAGKVLAALPEVAWRSLVNRNFHVFVARVTVEDLTVIGELMASGKVTPVIDRRYPLAEAADALRYLEEGHARGKVVITFDA